MKWIKRLGWLVMFLILAVLVIFHVFIPFRTSDPNTRSYFEEENQIIDIQYQTWQKGTLRYVSTAEKEDLPLVAFVHGGPGSSNNFYQYLSDSNLLAKAQMVAIDRPGYGYSDYGEAMPSLKAQAEAVVEVLMHWPNRKVLLVGHSYGGPIVAKVAAHYPDLVDAVLLLAPVIDPDNEKIFWFSPFSWWLLTRWMLPADLRVAGVEKRTHAKELEQMAGDWSKIHVPVVQIHGDEDFLAPASNIAFAKAHIDSQYLNQVLLSKAGHFIPWTEYDIVTENLIHLINQVKDEEESDLERASAR